MPAEGLGTSDQLSGGLSSREKHVAMPAEGLGTSDVRCHAGCDTRDVAAMPAEGLGTSDHGTARRSHPARPGPQCLRRGLVPPTTRAMNTWRWSCVSMPAEGLRTSDSHNGDYSSVRLGCLNSCGGAWYLRQEVLADAGANVGRVSMPAEGLGTSDAGGLA